MALKRNSSSLSLSRTFINTTLSFARKPLNFSKGEDRAVGARAETLAHFVEGVIGDVGPEHLSFKVEFDGLFELDVRQRNLGTLPVAVGSFTTERGEER